LGTEKSLVERDQVCVVLWNQWNLDFEEKTVKRERRCAEALWRSQLWSLQNSGRFFCTASLWFTETIRIIDSLVVL